MSSLFPTLLWTLAALLPAVAPAVPPPSLRRLVRASCMIVLATDAPLSSRNLERLARRAVLGLARTGHCAEDLLAEVKEVVS